MGSSELTQAPVIPLHAGRRHARRIALAYTALWALTGAGALIGAALPALVPAGRPHPSLHGTLSDLAAIAATNARTLSAPFLLALLGFPAHRSSRRLGDLLLGVLLAGNALRVGAALVRWRGRLLPYVPQLPVEWLAVAVAAAAWLTLRGDGRRDTALAYLAAVLTLVVSAAAIETTCTPHAPAQATQEKAPSLGVASRAVHAPLREDRGWLVFASDRAPAPALAARSLRFLPLALARFRSAGWPALPGYVNHPGSRKGGTSP
jgi:hypothetical protein